jgi:hypothetical protein
MVNIVTNITLILHIDILCLAVRFKINCILFVIFTKSTNCMHDGMIVSILSLFLSRVKSLNLQVGFRRKVVGYTT